MTHPRERRASRRDQTHERIYAAAMGLFAEHGFDRVSVAQIAAAAGVSVPTFYAHFPAKEQVVMHIPSPEAVAEVLARQPADLPVAERMRRAARDWFAGFGPAERAELLARWRIVVTHPGLRLRSAEVERITAWMILDHMRTADGTAGPADAVVVNAYLSVVNTVVVAWADAEGRRTLEELTEEAFDALRGN